VLPVNDFYYFIMMSHFIFVVSNCQNMKLIFHNWVFGFWDHWFIIKSIRLLY